MKPDYIKLISNKFRKTEAEIAEIILYFTNNSLCDVDFFYQITTMFNYTAIINYKDEIIEALNSGINTKEGILFYMQGYLAAKNKFANQ